MSIQRTHRDITRENVYWQNSRLSKYTRESCDSSQYISVLDRACLTDSDCNQHGDNYKCEDEVCKCDSSKWREVNGLCQSCKYEFMPKHIYKNYISEIKEIMYTKLM